MVIEGPRSNNELFNERGYWSLPTDIDLVAPAEAAFAKRLKRSGWSEDLDDFKLVFREALINAMKHGSKDDPDKKVKVEIKVSKERVYIQIRDEGEGFDPAQLPDPLLPENLLKSSGRGIFLMNNFFDSVTHEDGGKKIIMVKTKKEI